MKFEDKLWHKHDLLHERYRSHHETATSLLDMLSKMKNSAKDYSRSLSSLTSKPISILKSFDSSLGKGLDGVQYDLSIQSNEFAEMSEMLKSKVIDPVKSLMDIPTKKRKILTTK